MLKIKRYCYWSKVTQNTNTTEEAMYNNAYQIFVQYAFGYLTGKELASFDTNEKLDQFRDRFVAACDKNPAMIIIEAIGLAEKLLDKIMLQKH